MIHGVLEAILIGFISLWGEHHFLRTGCLLVGFWNGAPIVLRSFSPRSSCFSRKEKAGLSSSLSITHLFWLVSLFLIFFPCFHDLSASLIPCKPNRAYGSVSKPSNRDLLGSSQEGQCSGHNTWQCHIAHSCPCWDVQLELPSLPFCLTPP